MVTIHLIADLKQDQQYKKKKVIKSNLKQINFMLKTLKYIFHCEKLSNPYTEALQSPLEKRNVLNDLGIEEQVL